MDIIKSLKEMQSYHEDKSEALLARLRTDGEAGNRALQYMHEDFAKACKVAIEAISGVSE